MNKTTPHLTTKEIQSMTNDDIIKHVYMEHKRTELPVEAVWERLFADFGKQTVNAMLKDSHNSWNNAENFETDSRYTELGIVYVFAFGLVWVVFHFIMKNKFEALQFAIVVCGFISICITSIFMNIAGKNEKQFLYAISKLRKAYSTFTNRGGFKSLTGKSLEYVE
jgi:magnesium-transporting ATPase (P-type)